MLERLQRWLVDTDSRLVLALVSSCRAVKYLVLNFGCHAVMIVATFTIYIALVLYRAVVPFVLIFRVGRLLLL